MRTADNPWFEAYKRKDPPHESLVQRIQELQQKQQTFITNTRQLISMYEYGFGASGYSVPTGATSMDLTQLAHNYARNNIDTIHSKVIKNKVEPMALSSGGTYMARRKAKQKTKGHQAEFDRNDFDTIFARMSLDALVTDYGAGCIKVCIVDGALHYEHVPIEEIYADDDTGKDKREIFQVSGRDRYKVLEQFEQSDDGYYGTIRERVAGIEKAGQAFTGDIRSKDDPSRIDVYEGWRLPSRKGAGDGRHTMCVDGVCLVDEEFDWPLFPLIFYVPRPRLRSFWGLSMMRDVAPGQRALESMDARFERGAKRMGGTHILVRRGKVDVDELDNGQGTVISVDDPSDVTVLNPDLFNPQAMQWRESLVRWMAESRGISSLSTRSELPAGLQQASGKALEVFDDFESERMLPEHRAKEFVVVQLAKANEYGWRDLVRQGESAAIEYRFKGSLEKIDLRDIAIGDDEEPTITTFPVSQLARQPAARFQQVMEMMNAGWIKIEQARRLMEIPDLEAESELDSADCDAVDWAVDQIAFRGEPQTPDGYYSFDYAIERVRKHINVLRQYELPPDRMQMLVEFEDMLRQKRDELAGVQQPPAAGPQPMMPPPEMGPPPMGGPPMPPPGPPMNGAPPPEGMPPPMAA